jgi:hypothetical protein
MPTNTEQKYPRSYGQRLGDHFEESGSTDFSLEAQRIFHLMKSGVLLKLLERLNLRSASKTPMFSLLENLKIKVSNLLPNSIGNISFGW